MSVHDLFYWTGGFVVCSVGVAFAALLCVVAIDYAWKRFVGMTDLFKMMNYARKHGFKFSGRDAKQK